MFVATYVVHNKFLTFNRSSETFFKHFCNNHSKTLIIKNAMIIGNKNMYACKNYSLKMYEFFFSLVVFSQYKSVSISLCDKIHIQWQVLDLKGSQSTYIYLDSGQKKNWSCNNSCQTEIKLMELDLPNQRISDCIFVNQFIHFLTILLY